MDSKKQGIYSRPEEERILFELKEKTSVLLRKLLGIDKKFLFRFDDYNFQTQLTRDSRFRIVFSDNVICSSDLYRYENTLQQHGFKVDALIGKSCFDSGPEMPPTLVFSDSLAEFHSKLIAANEKKSKGKMSASAEAGKISALRT